MIPCSADPTHVRERNPCDAGVATSPSTRRALPGSSSLSLVDEQILEELLGLAGVFDAVTDRSRVRVDLVVVSAFEALLISFRSRERADVPPQMRGKN